MATGDGTGRPGRAPHEAPEVHPCRHCGSKLEGRDRYCCPGCEAAAALIAEAGLDRYYEERAAPAPRPTGEPSGLDRIPPRVLPDGHHELRFRVDGLRCASCVWVTEGVLQGAPGVVSARVAYTSGRAVVVYDPARATPGRLAERLTALGYHARPRNEPEGDDTEGVRRFAVGAGVAVALMAIALAGLFGALDGLAPSVRAMIRGAQVLLASVSAGWAAAPFHRGALGGLRARVWTMDQPIALGVAVMYAHGVAVTLTGGVGFFDSMGMLVALLSAGRLLEARGRRQSRLAAESLAAHLPQHARRIGSGGSVTDVDADTLVEGDEIVLGAGEEVPADAQIIDGTGAVRMALLTGESEPVAVGPADRLVAGGIVADGGLRARVTAVGGHTLLGHMADELRDATDRPRAPSATAFLAPAFTAGTLVVGVATFAGWAYVAGFSAAIAPTAAVLVVACPCALALAEPLAIAAGLGAAASRGLLLRNGDALLQLAEVDTVAFDKTGTVTGGAPVVADAEPATLRIAAGLERFSVHPVARAIVEAARLQDVAFPDAHDVEEIAGHGIAGTIDGRRYHLRSGGAGLVRLWGPDGHVGDIVLRDVPRADAAATLRVLAARGLHLALLTGDHADVARRIGRATGIDDVRAGLNPIAKAYELRERAAEGHRVLFVGDGLNDGLALTTAHVGLVMGSGAAPSLLASDGVIAGDRLAPVVAGVRAGFATRLVIRRNIVFTVAYNGVAVTAAALGYVSPLVAAVSMPLSSAIVIVSAMAVERRIAAEERPR